MSKKKMIYIERQFNVDTKKLSNENLSTEFKLAQQNSFCNIYIFVHKGGTFDC